MAHHHFTRNDRVFLAKLRNEGLSVRACARILKFHPSTVYRELTRGNNPETGRYSVRTARTRARILRTTANQQHRKLREEEAAQLLDCIRQDYSPEQAGHAVGLSRSTVYRWLWALPKAVLKGLWCHLRHPKLRRKYGTKRRERQRELAEKCWIDARPDTIHQRLFYGHWEGDTVRGKRHSGYALVGFIPRATKEAFRQEAERLLAPLPSHLKRSLTLDNGTEMSDYEALERHTGIRIYFAHPYHSWERGTNENFNGLLRQYFPKQMSFTDITQKQVDFAANLLNTRPRKRHDYRSPAELLKPYMSVAI